MPQIIEIEKKNLYTLEDYLRLPEGAPYQLIKGVLVMSPSPSPVHQEILKSIGVRLVTWVEPRGLGKVYFAPIDVYFTNQDVYQPDIIFISKDRLEIIGDKRIDGPGDLIIEILSPATAYYDLRIKKDVYEKSGVKEYWIVDPLEKIIEVHVNEDGRFRLHQSVRVAGEVVSVLVEGFKIDLKEIFE